MARHTTLIEIVLLSLIGRLASSKTTFSFTFLEFFFIPLLLRYGSIHNIVLKLRYEENNWLRDLYVALYLPRIISNLAKRIQIAVLMFVCFLHSQEFQKFYVGKATSIE